MKKIQQSGWYTEGDCRELVLVATDPMELVEYLDNTGQLNRLVTEYICTDYDMESFISEIMEGREYMSREDMINAFMEHELKIKKCYDTGEEWLDWFEEGEVPGGDD